MAKPWEGEGCNLIGAATLTLSRHGREREN
jgi:hypothetical protein